MILFILSCFLLKRIQLKLLGIFLTIVSWEESIKYEIKVSIALSKIILHETFIVNDVRKHFLLSGRTIESIPLSKQLAHPHRQ